MQDKRRIVYLKTKNNSYEVSFSLFLFSLCFYSFESWFDITSITETAEDIIAKEREQNILHMLHQVFTFSLRCFFSLFISDTDHWSEVCQNLVCGAELWAQGFYCGTSLDLMVGFFQSLQHLQMLKGTIYIFDNDSFLLLEMN